MITIVYPAQAHRAYQIAAETFAHLAEQTTNEPTKLMIDAQFSAKDNHRTVVLIGSDAVNTETASLYLTQKTDRFGIRYGTDDYAIRSVKEADTTYLILAGGRPRAVIYAVYRYFEHFCGCRWFWDGDRISKCSVLPTERIELVESPRFEYRGLRYFAHRSLHRFQAEQWSWTDWQTEIDWMLKKRLNMFMLRIGMDDLFQKAFPELVSYPERDEQQAGNGPGYDDRTLFWSLEYRGELRKKILKYAFERDLMHPEDCGTISHWYSRTPAEYLEKRNPKFLPQATKSYSEPSGRVWDIREKEYLDDYFKLTETHIREYGKSELFHTIGLGERLYSQERDLNQRMKLYVYWQIVTRIKEQYPNAPLLIASWDLWMRFTPEEVRELIAELDPTQAILLDYTSDTMRENNFTAWNVMGNFPWIFGIFSAYEPNSDIRGYYEWTNERLKLAKADPACKGLILWPELSHGDPFTIEYFAHQAWEKETLPVLAQVERYCRDRYPQMIVQDMTDIWKHFLPIASLLSWSMDASWAQSGNDIFPVIVKRAKFGKENVEAYQKEFSRIAGQKEAAVYVLNRLAAIGTNDVLTQRDLFDLARTVIGRFINGAIVRSEQLYAEEQVFAVIETAMQSAENLMRLLAELLGAHEDYSLYVSLKELQSVIDTNPNFEATLKRNAECDYCRSYIYENAAYLYLPEMQVWFAEVKNAVRANVEPNADAVASQLQQIKARYFITPLQAMRPSPRPVAEILRDAATVIGTL